jgi:hypothetical protein
MMDVEDAIHAQTGRAFFRDGAPDLADDLPLWKEVWSSTRSELLTDWIARHPGTRPEAFWRFDTRGIVRLDGESEVVCLHRHHLISTEEIGAIVRRCRTSVRYNRGRHPDRPGDNFIVPGELERFAASVGLLSGEEMAILGLDQREEDI